MKADQMSRKLGATLRAPWAAKDQTFYWWFSIAEGAKRRATDAKTGQG